MDTADAELAELKARHTKRHWYQKDPQSHVPKEMTVSRAKVRQYGQKKRKKDRNRKDPTMTSFLAKMEQYCFPKWSLHLDWPGFSLDPGTVNLDVQKERVTSHLVTGAPAAGHGGVGRGQHGGDPCCRTPVPRRVGCRTHG